MDSFVWKQWKPGAWPAFYNVTSISEPARMLGNGREMCTRHPGGDWAASVLFPVQLRRGPGSCALHAFLCLPGPARSTVSPSVTKFRAQLVLDS